MMGSKIIAVILVSLFVVFSSSGHCLMFSKNKTQFEWLATETAPANYTMKIISGTFYYHNKTGGLYVPTAARINPGWGIGVSTHVVGEEYKSLPDRLDIRFFSYAENKMYQGSFDLPYEKILNLFKAGVKSNKDDPTFKKIMVGVAPGGVVAVWVTGYETREVFFGKAKPYDGELTNSLDNVVENREEFVRRGLEDSLSSEILTDIQKNGIPFGKWDNYRKQYSWIPTFAQEQKPKYCNVAFFSGESYKIEFPLSSSMAKELRHIPKQLSFGYFFKEKEWEMFFTVIFNEEEIFAAFDQLGNDEVINLEFDPKLPKTLTTVRIYNSKKSIQLKKVTQGR